jgi:hypothetical protein
MYLWKNRERGVFVGNAENSEARGRSAHPKIRSQANYRRAHYVLQAHFHHPIPGQLRVSGIVDEHVGRVLAGGCPTNMARVDTCPIAATVRGLRTVKWRIAMRANADNAMRTMTAAADVNLTISAGRWAWPLDASISLRAQRGCDKAKPLARLKALLLSVGVRHGEA